MRLPPPTHPFLGQNGAGKTTTLKMLLAMVKPSTGSAHIFGMDATTDGLAVRERIGYLPQSPQFFGHLTVWQAMELAASFFYAGPNRLVAERIRDALGLVAMSTMPTGG